jgi:hypothetical protein
MTAMIAPGAAIGDRVAPVAPSRGAMAAPTIPL